MKKYMKPEIEVCQIETPQIMSVSSVMGEYDPSLPLNGNEIHFDLFDEE